MKRGQWKLSRPNAAKRKNLMVAVECDRTAYAPEVHDASDLIAHCLSGGVINKDDFLGGFHGSVGADGYSMKADGQPAQQKHFGQQAGDALKAFHIDDSEIFVWQSMADLQRRGFRI